MPLRCDPTLPLVSYPNSSPPQRPLYYYAMPRSNTISVPFVPVMRLFGIDLARGRDQARRSRPHPS
eukprot:594755-Rhodomonas_salina.2